MNLRRALLLSTLSLPFAAALAEAPKKVLVEIWKDPNCGCCKDWVKHLEGHGFATKVNDTGNEAMRRKLGMPEKLGSCHTALVGGYAIEGHVPAADIQRLLKERPQAIGLTVPGMPVGSPGMDQPIYGERRDPYQVLLVAKNGETKVYAAYNVAAAGAAGVQGKLAEGEVRRVDKSAGKITLKHGEIRNLDMPPMTMVFGVRDKSLLAKLQAGDMVRFAADRDGGQYVVTSIEKQ